MLTPRGALAPAIERGMASTAISGALRISRILRISRSDPTSIRKDS